MALVIESAGGVVVLIFAPTFYPHAASLIAWAGGSDFSTREVNSEILGLYCEVEEVRTKDYTSWANDGGECDVLHDLFLHWLFVVVACLCHAFTAAASVILTGPQQQASLQHTAKP